MENKERFQFTYSAKEQAEIEAIRKKYSAPEQTEDKMAQLRHLDATVTQKATTASLIFGVIGTLIMGTGMSIIMTDIAIALGSLAMALGVLLGVAGLVLVALAYPIYNLVLKKNREKIAPEILRLSDELLK